MSLAALLGGWPTGRRDGISSLGPVAAFNTGKVAFRNGPATCVSLSRRRKLPAIVAVRQAVAERTGSARFEGGEGWSKTLASGLH
jgi:hypothetical protein